MTKIRTYLDTGVIIAAFHGKAPLADAAFEIMDDPEREFVVTDFLKLELLPKAVFHRQEEEAAFYNDFLNGACATMETTPARTAAAFELACQYGLAAVDSIHIRSAIDTGAAEFVTTEKPEKPMFRVTDQPLRILSLMSPQEDN